MGSPAFVERLAQRCLDGGEKMPCKEAFAGGAPMYSRTCETISSAIRGRRLIVVYGSTEAEPISLIESDTKLQLERDARKAGKSLVGHCVGMPVTRGSVAIIKTCDGKLHVHQ